MHGVTGSPLSVSYIRKVLLLNKFLISFKVSFNQYILTSAVNLVTSAKSLGYGMKCDNSDPYFTKAGNELCNYFTTDLNTLCNTLTTLFAEISYTSH